MYVKNSHRPRGSSSTARIEAPLCRQRSWAMPPAESGQDQLELVQPNPAGPGWKLGGDVSADILFDVVGADFRAPGQRRPRVRQVLVEPHLGLGREPRHHLGGYTCHVRTSPLKV